MKDRSQISRVNRRIVDCLHPFEIKNISSVHRQRNESRRVGLQKISEDVQLGNVIGIISSDERTPVGDPVNNAHALQRDQRVTHNVALDIEFRDQLVFDQTLSWMQPPKDDIFLKF